MYEKLCCLSKLSRRRYQITTHGSFHQVCPMSKDWKPSRFHILCGGFSLVSYPIISCFTGLVSSIRIILLMFLLYIWNGNKYNLFRRFSKKLSTSVVVHQTIFYQIIKINKTQLLLKYFFGPRGVKFLEKRWENVQTLQALRWRFDVWAAIFAVKNDGMSARNSYIT